MVPEGNNQLLYLERLRKWHRKKPLHAHSSIYQKLIPQVFVKKPRPLPWSGEGSRALTQVLSAQSRGPPLPSSGQGHIPPVASTSFARCSRTL